MGASDLLHNHNYKISMLSLDGGATLGRQGGCIRMIIDESSDAWLPDKVNIDTYSLPLKISVSTLVSL